MAFIFADRVRDVSTTTGTGAFTVSGTAPVSYRTFSAVCTTNDTLPYFIAHRTADEWEVGEGTYSSANTLTRTTVKSSSNAGSAVSFSAGTKDVVLSLEGDITTMRKWLSSFVAGNGGTVSSGTFTVDRLNGSYQFYTNNGAHTVAAPASDQAVDILITNGASAGAITFSGFTVGGSTGDALTTTNGSKFYLSVRRVNSVSTYQITALQ